MIPYPEVFAYIDDEPMVVATFAGDVQWYETGEVVQLPTEADVEHLAMQRASGLNREDGRPILVGRDTPSQEQLAAAEAAGELAPLAGEPEPPFSDRGFVDVDTGGRL